MLGITSIAFIPEDNTRTHADGEPEHFQPVYTLHPEQPSPLMLLLSSHCYIPFNMPLPQAILAIGVHTDGIPWHIHPSSIRQSEQPSFITVLPSSHSYN